MIIPTTLPVDSAERKRIPTRAGCIDYFPAAIAGVAIHSVKGNEKHNLGGELHHSRGKSMDHAECIDRHLMDMADLEAAIARDPGNDGSPNATYSTAMAQALLEEADALAWRALALSQELHEKYGGAPLAPRARLPKPVTVSGTAVHSSFEVPERVVGMVPELAAPFGQCVRFGNCDCDDIKDCIAPGPSPLPQCLWQNGDGTSCTDAAVHGGPYCQPHASKPSI